MGQEIDCVHFEDVSFDRFKAQLEAETARLADLAADGGLSRRGPTAGVELEAWLVDEAFCPAPINQAFLKRLADPLMTVELARFNVELNTPPQPLTGPVLHALESQLRATWDRACTVAKDLNARLLAIGILPTLAAPHLSLHNMSPLNRYRALNEQVLKLRAGRPLEINIQGREGIKSQHQNVMLESATTSFQIHLQCPYPDAYRLYNAALIVSAPMLAACVNAPFLFGHDLWDETRVPVFEQAVDIGGFDDAIRGPLRRVSFGSGYARQSLIECFEENLHHFPVLLPIAFDTPDTAFRHLQLHNGTIWRWNRPLIGFDADGTPHLRIEHRVLPGGPSLVDIVANAALFYGLVYGLLNEVDAYERRLDFGLARDNFYTAARVGLEAHLTWLDGQKTSVRRLLDEQLLPLAHRGLDSLGVEPADRARYLDIIEARVASGQTGAIWQRRFVARHGRDWQRLTEVYAHLQAQGQPVHTWPV